MYKLPIRKIVAFDMDGTLINERIIYAIGKKFGFLDEVTRRIDSNLPGYEEAINIAKLLRGLKVVDVLNVIKDVPLTQGAETAIKHLKSKGFKLGIISNSYTYATSYFRQKLNLDFDVANSLEEKRGTLTGNIFMPMGWLEENCDCKQSVCKQHFLKLLSRKMRIHISNSIAVGDNTSDECMIRSAGIGVAFNPKTSSLANYAKLVINKPDLREILKYL